MSNITVEIYQTTEEINLNEGDFNVVILGGRPATPYAHDHDTLYYRKSVLDSSLNEKQALLVSGSNIKTINNTSILGSGNIVVEGGEGGGITAEKIRVVNSMPITFAEGDICFNASDNGLYIGVD